MQGFYSVVGFSILQNTMFDYIRELILLDPLFLHVAQAHASGHSVVNIIQNSS